MPLLPVGRTLLGARAVSEDNIIHFRPWQDFNDAPQLEHPFGVEPDPVQIAIFLDVVFGWCEGQIPVRGFVDMGQGKEGRPHNIWIDADAAAPAKLATFANWAWREGAAVYVIPGSVAAAGQAKSADVLLMQALVVDLDAGDIPAKLDHLLHHLGQPTLIIESGGRTAQGAAKLHVWWKMTEPAEGTALAELCRLRGEIALKVGGDTHFRSAHQPIRVAGSVYHKHGHQRLVQIREHHPIEVDLDEFSDRVAEMPPMPGAGVAASGAASLGKPSLDAVLTTPVREGDQDEWSRFTGASIAIGHFLRMVHDGRMSPDDGWEAIRGYNAAALRPSWPEERLKAESERLWAKHIEKNGPPLIRATTSRAMPTAMPAFSLGALLDDVSPMPEDLIAPRVLTPGGLLVLGGAPKVGKSDFLICWLVLMAAGLPFLGFTPPRPLRIFYLQAEIQYHYLRERLQLIRLAPAVIAAARDTFVATPKLRLLLDDHGVTLAADAIRQAFPDAPPDIICIDPIRNLFDGGPDGGGENDNGAMMFFLQARVEVLRDAVNPDCGVILAHHTRKTGKQQVKDDPFLALSGASALRGFYTSGLIMHRPDEDRTERRLEIELRNGPALPAMIIDKVGGAWVQIDDRHERLVRQETGARHDAERVRKGDVILGMIAEQAAQGRMFTLTQFGAKFENKGSLGGQTSIRERLHVLATKGHVKFVGGAQATALGLKRDRSKFGYLCVRDMHLRTAEETVDADTGEVIPVFVRILPTGYMCAQSGALLPVENPEVWVDQEGEDA
jgi:hypothetical protein